MYINKINIEIKLHIKIEKKYKQKKNKRPFVLFLSYARNKTKSDQDFVIKN